MNPIFVAAEDHLAAAERELAKLDELLAWLDRVERDPRLASDPAPLARALLVANEVEAAYGGIEAALGLLVRAFDGSVLTGPGSHAALLAQAVSPNPNVRPSVIGPGTRALLDEFRRFRHVVRHGYGSNLKLSGALDNLALLRQALPLVQADVAALKAAVGSG